MGNKSEKATQYMVLSSQGLLPASVYDTLEEAEIEAKKQAHMDIHRKFSIIKIIKTYKAKIEVEEI